MHATWNIIHKRQFECPYKGNTFMKKKMSEISVPSNQIKSGHASALANIIRISQTGDFQVIELGVIHAHGIK